MIKNYLKIAIANLTKSKVYSFISISSLTIGLAVCILLLLYVSHELSFDRYHKKADNIYYMALKIVKSSNNYFKNEHLVSILNRLSETGEFSKAFHEIQLFDSYSWKAKALLAISRSYLEASIEVKKLNQHYLHEIIENVDKN